MSQVDVEGVRKFFPISGLLGARKTVRAVDGVDLRIRRGEALGLVGESGSGKSTLGRLILRLIEPTEGSVFFEGTNIFSLKGNDLRMFRRRAQIVYQNPFLSLNPSLKVLQMLSEPILFHSMAANQSEAKRRVVEVLDLVGLGDELLDRYPHELSGGQMQRVAIARALSLNPEFIVFDEPTSSLDVSVQAQILNLVKQLKARLNLTYLFISHNLAVVSYVSDRVAVMYAGKIVEMASTSEFFSEPLHPYSQILLSSVPAPDLVPGGRERIPPKGEPPSPMNPPTGCRFHPRCPYAMAVCSEHEPLLTTLHDGRDVACFLHPEVTQRLPA